MKKVQVKNMTKNNIILNEAELADSFFTRLRGLIGRKKLDADTGLIISPCNSIHMIGMRFPIDAIFLDQDNVVCYMISNMKIMHISPIIKKAKYVIEAPVGIIQWKNIEINDRLDII